MTDTVYDQALQIVAMQVRELAANLQIATDIPEPRRFDWDDIMQLLGITIRWQDDVIDGRGTNERAQYGYVIHIVGCQGHRAQVSEETKAYWQLFQRIRRYYNERRRMDLVVDECTTQMPCVLARSPAKPPKITADYDIRMVTIIVWFLETRTP